MPRNSFFQELRKRYFTEACRAGRHEECDGEVIVGDPTAWPAKKKQCSCDCHLSPYERTRKEAMRKVNNHTRKR